MGVKSLLASCYDHAVVAQAKARGHEVVSKAIHTQRGVQPGTARVSLENAALSFAYDPARTSHAAIAGAVEKRLPAPGLSLRFLRAMP
ncbi:MAG: hypothetical protein ACT4P3_17615 [Betaproteobacteria bacterium]